MAFQGGNSVEEAKKRCRAVADRIHLLPISRISDSCKRTLLRLVNSELKFLTRLSASTHLSGAISSNIGYLESVVHILQQPRVTGVSRVCKPIPLSPSVKGDGLDSHSKDINVHVDIVCTLGKNPVWFVVSDRNPKYISWSGSHTSKGLRKRVEQLLEAAQSTLTLKPASLILFFANGLHEILSSKLELEFGASRLDTKVFLPHFDFSEELEGGWVIVNIRSYSNAGMFEIKVDCMRSAIPGLVNEGTRNLHLEVAAAELCENLTQLNFADDFCSLISKMKLSSMDVKVAEPELLVGQDLINFDTTTLIALVSGISNGDTEKLLAAPESKLRKRFKSNYEFVIAQVMSELQNPILAEFRSVISEKIGMVCDSVLLEFKELISMCGGPNEKLRAAKLLNNLMLVPDSPSARMMGLPTTRKIALKNKVVFGTGDYWCAPTLTANTGFIRAISQTGMSLVTIEHRPRALTGD